MTYIGYEATFADKMVYCNTQKTTTGLLFCKPFIFQLNFHCCGMMIDSILKQTCPEKKIYEEIILCQIQTVKETST